MNGWAACQNKPGIKEWGGEMAYCEHMNRRDRDSNHIAYYNFSKNSL